MYTSKKHENQPPSLSFFRWRLSPPWAMLQGMTLRLSLLAVFASATALSACGYTPLYAPNMGAATAADHAQIGLVEMASVKHNVGERRVAQAVEQELKLNYPNTGATLDVVTLSIKEDTTTLAVESTAAVSRAQLNLTGTLVVTTPEGKEVLKTTLGSATSYNVEATPYSTESGKTFARQTAARNLAAEVTRRLALFYRTRSAK